MPNCVAAITRSGFSMACWTESAPAWPCATSSAMRVRRTLTSENSAATKKALERTNSPMARIPIRSAAIVFSMGQLRLWRVNTAAP